MATPAGTSSPGGQAGASSPGAKSGVSSPGAQAAKSTAAIKEEIAEFVQTGVAEMTHGEGTVVESDDETAQSLYYSEGGSSTTSVSSSIFCFTYANGRRYHADRFHRADYFMPNDDSEQERLDLYHHIFLTLLGGKLGTAPLDNPQRVLDVGTGTGIWAIDFADENPQAEVIGTDVSPIQPSWVPPNLKFEIDDMEEDWTHPDNYFDYIHMRSLSGAFQHWDAILAQAYKKTAPGGYVEFQDYGCEVFTSDGTMLMGESSEHPIGTYFYHVMGAANRAGRPLIIARGMRDRLIRAGFVNVVERTAIWPLGPWPKDKHLKELGKWGRMGALESLIPFATLLLTREGWTLEQIQDLCDSVRKAHDKGRYYCHGWFVYGQKPKAEEIPL